ncbi:MAG: ABC transporter permease [Oscillospiraceae bacterium]|nr:ABC transporter permease [Oscillospiraceae bacterium]
MKGASLKYLTKEGFRSVWVNKLMSLASIAVLMACLVIIGLGAMIFFNINSLLDNIENQNVIMVFAENGATDEEVSIIGNKIKVLDNVEDCIFVPKDDALLAQRETLGADAALLDGLEENPLPDAYKVVVEDLSKFDATVAQLKAINGVQRVRENSDIAGKLVNIRKAVTIISVGIVALLFVVSLFIISNTIRITMFSRKLEISIMKAVGATNWFIRWPFMIEGINLGVISCLVSFIVLIGLYSGIQYICSGLIDQFNLVNFWDYAWYILGIFAVIGIFTGSVGSLISMGKYLKEQGGVINEDQ